jgi:hypothetical protein
MVGSASLSLSLSLYIYIYIYIYRKWANDEPVHLIISQLLKPPLLLQSFSKWFTEIPGDFIRCHFCLFIILEIKLLISLVKGVECNIRQIYWIVMCYND